MLSACQTHAPESLPTSPVTVQTPAKPAVCAKVRPTVCAAYYQATCGFDKAGKAIRTYGNACDACGDTAVMTYSIGECGK